MDRSSGGLVLVIIFAQFYRGVETRAPLAAITTWMIGKTLVVAAM
jgi:hypothetical protein